MNLGEHISPHVWEFLSPYFFNNLSTPFSLSSSETPMTYSLFMSLMSHKFGRLSIFLFILLFCFAPLIG